jgi:hypothetical protein
VSSLPVIERIVSSIIGRIANVTTDNGYNVTLNPVRQKKLGVITLSDGDALLNQADPLPDQEMTTEGNPRLVALVQPFHLVIICKPSDTSDRPIDQFLNIAVADVTKALQIPETPGDDWRSFGGLSYNAAFEPSQEFPSDGKMTGVVVICNVSYRTPENDPYTPA